MQHGRRTGVQASDIQRSPVLRLQLLGGFRAIVGDRVVPDTAWRSQKARSLVKLLGLAPRHQLHREEIIDLLWPDADPAAAANNFRFTLHAARRALEPDRSASPEDSVLRLRDNVLTLQPAGGLWIDIDAFESAASVARQRRAPADYRRALDLYTGDLLPEDRYEDWAAVSRAGLRERYLTLLVELGELCAQTDPGEAIDVFQRVVELEPAHEEAHAHLMRLYALTSQRRKALLQYQRLREVLQAELDIDPEPASQQLYTAILSGQFPVREQPAPGAESAAAVLPPHNLPVPLTSFIGREHEIAQVRDALATTRLLTLTGAGGCGKTRLALEVARDAIGEYPDGVWYVELAATTSPGLVPQMVASALGLPEQPRQTSIESLAASLRSKQALLVLDNCEHLVEACSRLAVGLLQSCPHLQVLATSREVLRAPGELAWRVPSLNAPEGGSESSLDQIAGGEAVRLFVDRARFVQPGFTLTEENADDILAICRRVEGLPLAIEMAAARIAVLTPGQLAERLENALQVLTGGSRTSDPRHQTLRATLAWSYDLLSEAEQRVFERLAVFTGGWTLEAAESVVVGGPVETSDVLDLLANLVDKSLVVTRVGPTESVRYGFLEPVRQYALEQLTARGETDEVRRRHAEYFVALASRAENGLNGARQSVWLAHLEVAHDNIRTALGWAFEHDLQLAAQLAAAMWRFWYMHGHLNEGREWVARAVTQVGSLPAGLQPKVFHAAASLAWSQGDLDDSRRFCEQALDLYRKLDDSRGIRNTLSLLGTNYGNKGEYDLARRYHEESLAMEREAGNIWGIARSLGSLGELTYSQGDFEATQTYWEESLELDRQLGDIRSASITVNNLGEVMRALRNFEAARERFNEALAMFRDVDFKHGVATALSNQAEIYLLLGDNDRVPDLLLESIAVARELGHPLVTAHFLEVTAELAISQGMTAAGVRLLGASRALRESTGTSLSPAEEANLKPWFESACAALTGTDWDRAWQAGQAVEQAIALIERISDAQETPPPAQADASVLTRREQEIVPLLAGGLTNAQIAARLAISTRTADTHVSNILRKLGLGSRAEVAAWAEEHTTIR